MNLFIFTSVVSQNLLFFFLISDVISEFPFLLPKNGSSATFDEDNDLDIERPQKEVIKIGKI